LAREKDGEKEEEDEEEGKVESEQDATISQWHGRQYHRWQSPSFSISQQIDNF
jgi:hypothetical protein